MVYLGISSAVLQKSRMAAFVHSMTFKWFIYSVYIGISSAVLQKSRVAAFVHVHPFILHIFPHNTCRVLYMYSELLYTSLFCAIIPTDLIIVSSLWYKM